MTTRDFSDSLRDIEHKITHAVVHHAVAEEASKVVVGNIREIAKGKRLNRRASKKSVTGLTASRSIISPTNCRLRESPSNGRVKRIPRKRAQSAAHSTNPKDGIIGVLSAGLLRHAIQLGRVIKKAVFCLERMAV
jgi:hypothetical protein